jgi:hypothetical protein
MELQVLMVQVGQTELAELQVQMVPTELQV